MSVLLSLASDLWSWRWLVVAAAFGALLLWLDVTRGRLDQAETNLSAARGQIASLLTERNALLNRHAVEMAAVKQAVEQERTRRDRVDREMEKKTYDKGPVSDAVRAALDSVRRLRSAGSDSD